MLITRLIIVAAIATIAYFLYQRFVVAKANRVPACPKCEGLGYWEGVRSKETCDRCKGSGEL